MSLRITSFVAALAVFSAIPSISLKAAPITIPFTAPISTTNVGNDLADVVHGGIASSWAVQQPASTKIYQFTSNATTTGSSTAVWQSSNITGATTLNWSQTIVLNLNDQSVGARIGIFALGSGDNTLGFLADVDSTAMRIIALGPNTSIATGTFTGVGLNTAEALAKTYTMTLAGTYAGSNLSLAYTLSDGTNSTTISGAAAGLTLTASNNYFGVRNNRITTGDALGLEYSSIAIIPEPSTAVMLGLATLGLCFRFVRRRMS